MSRKIKTGNTPGRVLRFQRAGRTSHHPAARQARRQTNNVRPLKPETAVVNLTAWREETSQYQKRYDLFAFITKRPDLQRLELLHRVLQADEATATRIAEALNQ